MPPEVYRHILVATIAGGISGVLIMWNRKRAQIAGRNKLRGLTVLTIGTAASACALLAFRQAFADSSPMYAAMVVMVVTSWAALLHSVVPIPLPRFVLGVRPGEFALLRSPWTGVRRFGVLLRNTPLRHLGGQVYLADAGREPRVVLRGLHDAETVHLLALLLGCPWFVFWVLHGRWLSVACGLAVQIPLNVYPSLHLRQASWRIERCLARKRRGAGA